MNLNFDDLTVTIARQIFKITDVPENYGKTIQELFLHGSCKNSYLQESIYDESPSRHIHSLCTYEHTPYANNPPQQNCISSVNRSSRAGSAQATRTDPKIAQVDGIDRENIKCEELDDYLHEGGSNKEQGQIVIEDQSWTVYTAKKRQFTRQ